MAIRIPGLPLSASLFGFGSAKIRLPLALLLAFAAAGCASPGEPTARKPLIPQPVANLSAAQSGNSVLLTFTVPQISVGGAPLEHAPDIQIYRDFGPAPVSGEAQPTVPSGGVLLVTVPSELVPRYVAQGKFRYSDSLDSADFTNHPNAVVAYSVRTRASEKKASAPSNFASLHIYPAPEAISDLKGEMTPAAVALTWTAPQRTPVGPAPSITAYRIYRAESKEPSASSGTSGEAASPAVQASNSPEPTSLPGVPPAPAALTMPLVKVGESASPGFRDSDIELGKTYIYSVRSVVAYSGVTIESSDSNFCTITPRDTFPPPAPAGLIAVFVPAAGNSGAHIDLSWDVSQAADLAGYRVYRSEEAGIHGTSLSGQLLLTPAFRDMNVVPGHSYSYTVAAVDRSGNESAPSAAASVSVP